MLFHSSFHHSIHHFFLPIIIAMYLGNDQLSNLLWHPARQFFELLLTSFWFQPSLSASQSYLLRCQSAWVPVLSFCSHRTIFDSLSFLGLLSVSPAWALHLYYVYFFFLPVDHLQSGLLPFSSAHAWVVTLKSQTIAFLGCCSNYLDVGVEPRISPWDCVR